MIPNLISALICLAALILSYIYLQETVSWKTDKSNRQETRERGTEMKSIVSALKRRPLQGNMKEGYEKMKADASTQNGHTLFDVEEGDFVTEAREGQGKIVVLSDTSEDERLEQEPFADAQPLTTMSINGDDVYEGEEVNGIGNERKGMGWLESGKRLLKKCNPGTLLAEDSIFRNPQCITTCTLYALLGATFIIIDQVNLSTSRWV